ncbi:MAG: 1,4-dihydroxy-2-naphthoate polyprenyltransferase [Verrucomicrobiota bacterium]|nr:1,4-dihydroxy-2-naphthoate polyprenyltransferase [Verrucomicrobiota bacterium]
MLNPWIQAARPKTLPAAVAPVLMATAIAWSDGTVAYVPATICLLFALLIQIGTNFANDYFDFIKGADTAARIGPTRMVAAGIIKPVAMRNAMAAVFATAFVVGCGLLPYGGWWLLTVGIASVICGIAYTGGPYPLGYHGWGDVFVFIFFGLVAVCVTYYVQAGHFTLMTLLGGLATGALATNILVVNNYRDMATDVVAGKRTLAVRFGRRVAARQYLAQLLIAQAVPLVWTLLDSRAWPSVLALAVLPRGLAVYRKLLAATGREAFNEVLAGTALHYVLFTVLVCSGLVLAQWL